MDDGTRIDEELLHALLKGVYGEVAAKQFQVLYNAVSDVIERVANDAWDEGYDAGEADGLNHSSAKVNAEEAMADEAQLTMDRLWSLTH